MQALLHLIQRNNKLFRRDKTLMFFSLLSVFIVLILYIIFLQKMQLDSIASMIPVTNGIKTLVNEWMAAGMLSIMSVTTTLSALGLYIRDREEGGFLDLLTTPVRAMQLQLSYVANAWIIGMLFTCIGLFICELYIVFSGGEWLGASSLLQVLAIIALGVTVSSVMNCMLILFINGQSCFFYVKYDRRYSNWILVRGVRSNGGIARFRAKNHSSISNKSLYGSASSSDDGSFIIVIIYR